MPYSIKHRQVRAIHEFSREELEQFTLDTLSELYWVYDLIANQQMVVSPKSTLIALRRIASEKPANDDGLTRVYRQEIARYAGCSEQTVSDNLKKLADSGIIRKEVVRGWNDEKGLPDDALFTEILPQTMMSASDLVMENNRGGKRVKKPCPSCGGYHQKLSQYKECMECGTVFDQKTAIIEDEEEGVEMEPVVTEDPIDVGAQFIVHEQEFAVPPPPAPPRPCIVCGETNWAWDGTKWYCASHAKVEA